MRLALADAASGRRFRITAVDLDNEQIAWLGAFGLHRGEELVVVRLGALGGPLHIRTSSGGEFAVAREIAARIVVDGIAEESR